MNNQLFDELTAWMKQFNALKPELEFTVRDPELDIEGYVVVWNTSAGISGPLGRVGKGGTRVSSSVSLTEIATLAQSMTLKNAAAGVPLGGAKSGLRADPNNPDFERQYRRFINLCAPTLYVNGGPFGGFGFDMGGAPEQAVWACEELGRSDCFTGKSIAMGGTDYDREGIAGYGVAVAARTALTEHGQVLDNTTFGVQGLGAMGAAVVRFFTEFGAQLRVIADPRIGGTLMLPNAASAELIAAIAERDYAAVTELAHNEGAEQHDLDGALSTPVDVLFPAATQNVITTDNANTIAANYIIEAANGPITTDAYGILSEKHIDIVPDIIANPGGIIAAFVELTEPVSIEDNIANHTLVNRAKAFTEEKITDNVSQLIELQRTVGFSPRQAGEYLALSRLFN